MQEREESEFLSQQVQYEYVFILVFPKALHVELFEREGDSVDYNLETGKTKKPTAF